MGRQIYFSDEELEMLKRCVGNADADTWTFREEEMEVLKKERNILERIEKKLE